MSPGLSLGLVIGPLRLERDSNQSVQTSGPIPRAYCSGMHLKSHGLLVRALGKQILQAPESFVVSFQLLLCCQEALPDTLPQHILSSVVV